MTPAARAKVAEHADGVAILGCLYYPRRMSRYRSTRPDPRSKLAAPFLLRLAEIEAKRDEGRFPFTLPFMRRGGFALEFTQPVTFLIGENGTGKSSLLEAIARKDRKSVV